jgi:hypothetical protein
MQQIYIKSGYQLIEDLSMPAEDISGDIEELNKANLNPYK